jgi:Bestrophin, RFP-TM, chloride channel
VLPYCLINVAIYLLLVLLDHRLGYHVVEISAQGHTFITMVVAFLLVSRVNTGLARYNTARDAISTMHRSTRDVVASAVVFSNTCVEADASEWRNEVAYRASLMLRTATAVIEYPEALVTPWDVPELSGFELDDVKSNLYLSIGGNNKNLRWAHAEHSVWEESMRVPVRIAYLLTKTLHSQKKRLKEEIQVTQENKLLACVDSFMVGYDGIRKFLTTVRCIAWNPHHSQMACSLCSLSFLLARAISAHSNGPYIHVPLCVYCALCYALGQEQRHCSLLHGLCLDVRIYRIRGRRD